MAHEYTTLALLKRSLVGITDAARDDLLQDAIEAASRQIDNTCGGNRRFWLDTTVSARTYRPDDRTVRDSDGDRILVDDIGDTTGLIVEYGSTAAGWTVITADIETAPDNAIAVGWPVTSLRYLGTAVAYAPTSRLRVTAKWGWPSLPPEIGRATLIQAARLFKRQDSPEGVLGSAEWGTVRVSKVDNDVAALIGQYVIVDGLA